MLAVLIVILAALIFHAGYYIGRVQTFEEESKKEIDFNNEYIHLDNFPDPKKKKNDNV